MKRCIICGDKLTGKQTKYCKKGCSSAVWRNKNKEKNHEYTLAANRRREQERRAYINKKKEKPCTDCGIRYPFYVMQFDHVRGVKVAAIAVMKYYSWEKIDAELAKCELVCANCHAERTYRRRLVASIA
jgi:hypothetical protein